MSQIVENFATIKELVANLELDVVKNGEKHNHAAGVRVRKGLRQLKRYASELVKLTLQLDKETAKVVEAEPS